MRNTWVEVISIFPLPMFAKLRPSGPPWTGHGYITTSSMSVPGTAALEPTSTVGVPTRFPLESDVGSRVHEICRAGRQRLKFDDHFAAVEEDGQLIAEFRLELRRGERRRVGLIGENDPRGFLRRGFEERLDQKDRPRLQSGKHDGDENGRDESEFDRWRTSLVARQSARQAAHFSEEFAHAPHRRRNLVLTANAARQGLTSVLSPMRNFDEDASQRALEIGRNAAFGY